MVLYKKYQHRILLIGRNFWTVFLENIQWYIKQYVQYIAKRLFIERDSSKIMKQKFKLYFRW